MKKTYSVFIFLLILGCAPDYKNMDCASAHGMLSKLNDRLGFLQRKQQESSKNHPQGMSSLSDSEKEELRGLKELGRRCSS